MSAPYKKSATTAQLGQKSKPAKVVYNPLSDSELDILEGLLEELANSVDEDDIDARQPLLLDAADGLFAALALSPSIMPIADWMALVFGDGRLPNKEITQRTRNLLIRHYNSAVHQFRKTDLSDYFPCISVGEDDEETADVAAWCAGFALGIEAQEEKWAERSDEDAWTEIYVIQALKDADAAGNIIISDDLDGGELELMHRKANLLELMKEEVGEALEEPVDALTLLLFALSRLQETMIKIKKPMLHSM
jgi:yecA family protein